MVAAVASLSLHRTCLQRHRSAAAAAALAAEGICSRLSALHRSISNRHSSSNQFQLIIPRDSLPSVLQRTVPSAWAASELVPSWFVRKLPPAPRGATVRERGPARITLGRMIWSSSTETSSVTRRSDRISARPSTRRWRGETRSCSCPLEQERSNNKQAVHSLAPLAIACATNLFSASPFAHSLWLLFFDLFFSLCADSRVLFVCDRVRFSDRRVLSSDRADSRPSVRLARLRH